jgi:replicative DNA helicase
MEIAMSYDRNTPQPLEQYIEKLLNKANDKNANQDPRVIQTGFDDIDDLFEGFRPGELILIAARPSVGKSMFIHNILANQNPDRKLRATYIAGTLSGLRIAEELLANKSCINRNKIVTRNFSGAERDSFETALNELNDMPLYIHECLSMTEKDIYAMSIRAKKEKGIDLIIINNLQSINLEHASDPNSENLAAIVADLKLLAILLDIPIVVLSNINRYVEERTDKRPTEHDVRRTIGSLNDIDTMFLIYRDEIYHEDSPDAGCAEITRLSKDSKFKSSTFRYEFDSSIAKFLPYQYDQYNEPYSNE